MWSGVGRPDDNKRFVSDIRTYAEGSGEMVLHLQALRYHAINASVERPHAFTQVVWGEDVSFLSPGQVSRVLSGVGEEESDEGLALARIAKVAALVAHKNPFAKVLEVALDESETDEGSCKSLWIDRIRDLAGPNAAGCAYRLSVPSQKANLQAREAYPGEGNISYAVHDVEPSFGGEDEYDVIVLKVSSIDSPAALRETLESAWHRVVENGFVAVVHDPSSAAKNSYFAAGVAPDGFEEIPGVKTARSLNLVYLGTRRAQKEASLPADKAVHLVHFSEPQGSTDSVSRILASKGWKVVEHKLPFDTVPERGTVVVADELFAPLLPTLGDDQFAGLRNIIQDKECRLLWVTMG